MNSGYICYVIVCKFLGIKIPGDIRKRFNINDVEWSMMNLAKEMGLKAKCGKITEKAIQNVNTPIIVKNKNGEYFIVLKYKDGKFLLMQPNQQKPEWEEEALFYNAWDGTGVILSNKSVDVGSSVFGFKWFIPSILKYKKQLIEVLLATFVIQIIGILTPLMTQVVVDKVLSHNALSTLKTVGIGIFIIYVYELILALAKSYLFVHTTNRIDVILSYRLMKHLYSLPLKYFESRRSGETIARVRELDTIRNFLTGTPLSSVIDIVFCFVYIVILLIYNVKLTFIVFASIPCYVVLSMVVTPLFRKRLEVKFEKGANTQSFLVESMNGIQTIKSFALESEFEEEWGQLQSEYVNSGYKTSRVATTSNAVGTFIQQFFDLLLLVFGAKAVLSGTFTVGQLVAFRMLSSKVSSPILRLVQLWQEYQQASLSVDRIGDIFNSPVEPASNMNLQSIPKLNGKIVFDRIVFRYKMDAPEVIKNLSFTIEENTIVGVVGKSGCGKSTVAKLIERLYIPESGKITIDGMDISMINPVSLRQQIGVVLQENFMFSRSIADNISIHCKGATIEQIMAAAKIAGAHDFIMDLPQGYDTIIGERGVALSGGQKQRIAIARAIIGNPRILIFDEATSALDYESESIIQNNLKEICKGRTVIMIAHRLSTLKDADKIMVIDKGQLAEYDTPKNLMASKGLYYSLYNMQMRGEVV